MEKARYCRVRAMHTQGAVGETSYIITAAVPVDVQKKYMPKQKSQMSEAK